MSYFKRIQLAIDHIEHRLNEIIVLADVAQCAYFSLYHFHRLFHCITGTSLKEYIRKRRLSEALCDLRSTDMKIIDIAFKYQYETPETFSRAFKSEHGVSPTNCRKNSGSGHYFAPFKLKNHTFIKGDMSMEPAIKTVPSFFILGYKLNTTTVDGKNFKEIPKFWHTILKSGYEPARTPDFERYDETRMKNPKSAECDIFVPIKRNN